MHSSKDTSRCWAASSFAKGDKRAVLLGSLPADFSPALDAKEKDTGWGGGM